MARRKGSIGKITCVLDREGGEWKRYREELRRRRKEGKGRTMNFSLC